MTDTVRDIFLAFVRVHVLHHATRERIYGAGMSVELARHGYRLPPGTLYPLLRRLELDGLLKCEPEVVQGRMRKYYQATPKGHRALQRIQPKISELVHEAVEEDAVAAKSTRRKPRA
jgi:PadR family transcriptional regulator PadR